MLTLDLPCSTRGDVGARQGGGSAPAASPVLRTIPCGGTKGQWDHSPSDSPGPSTLLQLHGHLRVLPSLVVSPQAGWSKVGLHSRKGQKHPKAQPNPPSHHGAGLALNLCTHKASEPKIKPSYQILPSPDPPEGSDTKSRPKGGMETTESSRSLPNLPIQWGTGHFPAPLNTMAPEVFLR